MLSAVAGYLGRLWGLCVLPAFLYAMRKRAQRFQIEIAGIDHVHNLAGPYLIVSNHAPAQVPLFGSFARFRILRRCNGSLDSFIYARALLEGAGRTISVAALCDRGWWSHRPFLRMLQKRLGQPFARAQIAALGYIPVEASPGCFQREFLRAVEVNISAGRPILIFPDGGRNEKFDAGRPLLPGAAHIAQKFGLPIVPACIVGSESWQPGRTIALRFGPPIMPEGLTKRETSARIAQEIGRLMREQAAGAQIAPVL